MGTKTIGLREDVYERLKSRKREGESFTDVVDRLIDESSADWEDTFGTLPSEEAEELERAVARSREMTREGLGERQREAIDELAGGEETDGN